MKSIFTDKQRQPGQADLKAALGETFTRWESLRKYVIQNFPAVTEHWHFSGDKYGWSFRASSTKRTLVYFLPRDKFFKVAFVFGQKATDRILAGNISGSVKKELEAAKVNAEGRGIRIKIDPTTPLGDIEELIRIKIAN